MKNRKIHIIPDVWSQTLCGKNLEGYDINVVLKKKNFDWCKTCKMLFNANYSYKYKKLLK